jgi:hypothetical protein
VTEDVASQEDWREGFDLMTPIATNQVDWSAVLVEET